MKEEDMKKREAVEVKNALDTNSFNVEKSLNEHRSKISQEVADEVDNAIREAREAVASEDLDRMNQAKTNLDNASMKIGQAVYAQGNQQSSSDEQASQNTEQQQNNEGEQQEEEKGRGRR